MITESDILVIGSGPAGLALAASLAGSGLSVTLLERAPESVLANPPIDGREIALTHPSKDSMTKLGIWQRIPEEEIYPLKEAKVQNGMSSEMLYFPVPKGPLSKGLDRLGNLIPNYLIRKASYEQVKTLEHVQLVCEAEVKEVSTTDQGAKAELADGRVCTAKLLVLADSRFSMSRAQMGIPVDMHQFGRTVIAFRVTHEESNHCTAVEMFHYGHTLALLPLGEYMSNMVLTIDSSKAQTFLDMSDDELKTFVEQQTQGRLGRVQICGERHKYPLVGTHARYFYTRRCALIGDAAVGMHPVTAHGYNLGLESARILAEEILNAHRLGHDFASEKVLSTYNRRHQLKTRPLYHGTNLIVKLFTQENGLAHVAREGVIRVSRLLPPIKHLITKQLTG